MVQTVSDISSIHINALNSKREHTPSITFTHSSTLERMPESDELIKKNCLSTGKKVLLVFGGIGLAALGIIAAVKNHNSNYLNKAQKTFQEVYMRKDISKDETIEILKRFKKLETIKNNDEYLKSLFKEIKKNYGFEELPISLDKLQKNHSKSILGGCDNINDTILIKPNLERKQYIDTLHHEFRHAKQNYMAFHYNPEKYIEAVNHNVSELVSDPTYKGLEIKEGIEWLSKYMGKPDKANVAKEYEAFAQNSLNSKYHYVAPEKNLNEYKNSFHEMDAYDAGEKIEKILKYIPDNIN